MRALSFASVVVTTFALGCADPLADATSRVDAPRVLAVRATPAEPLPNQMVRLEALFADASGALTVAPLAWTFCTTRKPLAELGPIARECLDPASSGQVALGSGLAVDGRVPRDVCQLFGPNPPPAMAGQPNGRPVDPDATGGYYQPTIAFRTDDPSIDATVAQLRVSCGLASAPTEAVTAFNQRYHRNENPRIDALVLDPEGAAIGVPEDGAANAPTVSAGQPLSLAVTWPSCPEVSVCGDGICGADETRTSCAADCTTPVGCRGAESYVAYDAASATLQVRREAIRVAWYSTAGELAEPRTGTASDDASTSSANTLTAPSVPGDFRVFVVLRDERGGADFRTYRFTVAP